MRGQLETDPGPCRRLHKKVHDRLAPEGGNFFNGALANRFESLGGVQDQIDLFGGEGLDIEQVFPRPVHRRSKLT